jgi:hypothetical protein
MIFSAARVSVRRPCFVLKATVHREDKKKGCFAFRPLDLPAIYRLVFVSCTFCREPPTEIPLSHINPTRPFYRSNPAVYSFCEHYLTCLAILFSYSLLSIVNHD